MATLEEISRRIEVAEDLQSVVRTMKTISAVGIRQQSGHPRVQHRIHPFVTAVPIQDVDDLL